MREELAGVVAQIQDLLKQGSLSSAPENTKTPVAVEKSEPVEEEEQLTEEETEDIEDEKLDPPRGMGLKFDEIEKMIDEVLALEKDS